MRYIDKSKKLEGVAYDVRGPVVEEANRMQQENVEIFNLNIGNPYAFDFFAPNEIVQDMAYNLRESEGYSNSKGIFSARKAIMQYCQLKKIPNVDIEGIYTGNGESELINLALQALLDDGDELLIPSPDYPLWTACCSLAGGTPVHYNCDEQAHWFPDIADIESKITPHTKGIVVINPNNPTGVLYPREVLEQIAEVARRHDLIIFADEIYDRMVMDGKEHIAIASLAPDVFCVNFNGLSKSHRIAGFRVGWMALSGDKRRVKGYIEGLNILSSMRLCANVPGQSIIQTALGGHQSLDALLVPGGRIFEQRKFMFETLNGIEGVSAEFPDAAFYIFPKLDPKVYHIEDDEKFALDLLRKEHVLIVHGGGFNYPTPDHFRIVYLPNLNDLKEVAGRLERFLATCRH